MSTMRFNRGSLAFFVWSAQVHQPVGTKFTTTRRVSSVLWPAPNRQLRRLGAWGKVTLNMVDNVPRPLPFYLCEVGVDYFDHRT